MTDNRYETTRMLTPPRKVLVDPRRIWVSPVRRPERTMPVTLGEKAAALDPRLGEEWIPALGYRWARLRFGEPAWFLEVELELRSANGHVALSLRQWVPWDCVKPA
ncbi:hypothetical protein [Nocardia niwae]|uniref:hypothetical protein n=1 Tax=Nocardia niwae TaxID=626084 RepID=UPI0033E1563F